MARTRQVKPELFKDTQFAKLSPYARLLYLSLPGVADREGRLLDDAQRIKTDTIPYESVDMENLLEELSSAERIIRYQVDGGRYIQIVNWHDEQKPNPKETISKIPAYEVTKNHEEVHQMVVVDNTKNQDDSRGVIHSNLAPCGLVLEKNLDFHEVHCEEIKKLTPLELELELEQELEPKIVSRAREETSLLDKARDWVSKNVSDRPIAAGGTG